MIIKKIALLLFFITVQALAMKPTLPIKGTEQTWNSYLSQLVNFSMQHNQTDGLKDILPLFNKKQKLMEYKNVVETETWFNDHRIDVPTTIGTLKFLLSTNEKK